MHADYSSVFRAPALDELYQSQVVAAFLSPPDPCGNSPTPAQQQHCTANGVPGGSYAQIEDDVSLMHQGGNTALGPERGYSFDAGIAFRSTGRVAWHASADYFHTRLNDFIEQGDAEGIANECANYGTLLACAKIERFPDGSLRVIDIRRSNLGRVIVQGTDFAGGVDIPTRAGRFGVQALVSALSKYDTQVFEGSETLPRAGRGNAGLILPKWRGLGAVTWSRDAWSARYTLQWIGSYTDCSTTLDNTIYCDRVPAVTYHDIEAAYRWPALQVQAGISNVTDRDPPYLNAIGNTNPATYRLLGRMYFLRIGYSPAR
jgi:iron complex outermembrane receptor protein